MPLAGRLAWRTVWPLGILLGKAVWGLRIHWEAPRPAAPYVVAANHLSHLDPPLIGVVLKRPVRYLAVDELYGVSRLLDATIGMFGAIPMPRGRVPLGALRTALAHLAAGGVVGMFPEGRRVERWGEEPPRRGAAWLATRAGVPLLPVAVSGTGQAFGIDDLRFHRARLRVVVGRAIHPRWFTTESDPVGAVTRAWRGWMDEQLGGD